MQVVRDSTREASKRGASLVLAFLAVLVACAAGVGALTGSTPSFISSHGTPSLSVARRLLDEGKIGEARKLFEEEYRRDVKSVEAIRGLALCARDEGDDETALQYFQKLTALAPKDRAGWRQLALAASRLGRDMEALSAAQTALSLAPEGDRAMSDLMTRLLTSDSDLLADPLKGVPGRRKGLDPVDRGAKGLDFDPLGDMSRPEPPDPTRGLPRPGRGD